LQQIFAPANAGANGYNIALADVYPINQIWGFEITGMFTRREEMIISKAILWHAKLKKPLIIQLYVDYASGWNQTIQCSTLLTKSINPLK
jgi:hypothetical protein